MVIKNEAGDITLNPTTNLCIRSNNNSAILFNFDENNYWNMSLSEGIAGTILTTYGLNINCNTLSCNLQTGSFYLDNQNEMIAQFNFAYKGLNNTIGYTIGKLYNDKPNYITAPKVINYYLPYPLNALSPNIYLGTRIYTHNIYISGNLSSTTTSVHGSGIFTCQFNSSISTNIDDLQTFAQALSGIGTNSNNIIPAFGLLDSSLKSQTVLGIYQYSSTTIGITTISYIGAGTLRNTYYFTYGSITDLVQSF